MFQRNSQQGSAPRSQDATASASPPLIKGVSVRKLTTYFAFLDALRDSGVTNMFGAVPYLIQTFGLSREKAVPVLSAWMKTFDGQQPPKSRAEKALEANL
jgi:hypothetical protein